MKNKLLPIGSIITVSGVDLMICSYADKKKIINNKSYDYICCRYPTGIDDNMALVKKEDIARVKFIGYQDNRFVKLKEEWERENGG